ncbi:MAG: hypothetical protein GTO29_08405 [Candidatus Latescibacteria bacterium]|nr:hypothetical protein [Candidatus Latescibacterota bacterium]NIO56184.1 hypothetical protein [Candidatus Latescibacterota bacterium]
MNALQFKKDEFKVTKQLLSREWFQKWLEEEGTSVLYDLMKYTRIRWFFGKRRAKRSLYRSAKKALKPRTPFVLKLEKHLNQLPNIIRKIGIVIKREGFKDLYSADSTQALVVVPRGIVQHDFTRHLLKELADADDLSGFWGLSKRILKEIATESEQLFFEHLTKGKHFVDPDCKGVFLEADPAYAWRLNEADGHYYYAYSTKHGKNLSKKKELKQFKSEMGEVLVGQKRHLKRLEPHQIFEIAETFRGR